MYFIVVQSLAINDRVYRMKKRGEGGREGGKKGGREGGKEGGREGGKEGGRENK